MGYFAALDLIAFLSILAVMFIIILPLKYPQFLHIVCVVLGCPQFEQRLRFIAERP
jgi:hypothetical protein